MFHRIHDKLGTAGLIVACVALVFAMLGGAYAATASRHHKKSKGLTIAQVKKLVIAEIMKHPGPAGPTGPQGSPGSNGTNGKDGANGTNGTNGKDGENGENGQNGEAVQINPYTGTACPDTESGVEFTNGSGTAYACNGRTGFAEELPPGKSEFGNWSIVVLPLEPSPLQENNEFFKPTWVTSISYPVPYPGGEGVENPQFVYVRENGEAFNGFSNTYSDAEAEGCPGTAAQPLAEPGHLCVYVTRESGHLVANPPEPQKPTDTCPKAITKEEEENGHAPETAEEKEAREECEAEYLEELHQWEHEFQVWNENWQDPTREHRPAPKNPVSQNFYNNRFGITLDFFGLRNGHNTVEKNGAFAIGTWALTAPEAP